MKGFLERTDVRLDLQGLMFIDDRDIGAVTFTPAFQFIELFQFPFILRDDELATKVQRNAVLAAVLFHHAVAGNGELRLEALRGVIEPGVQNAAVTPRGVRGFMVFFIDDADTGGGLGAFDLEGDGEADDAGADDEVVVRFRHRVSDKVVKR